MEGEAGVLEQRVEAPALDRRRVEPRERVRGEQQEGVEAERRAPPARPGVATSVRSLSRRSNSASTAPASASTVTHSSIEPS